MDLPEMDEKMVRLEDPDASSSQPPADIGSLCQALRDILARMQQQQQTIDTIANHQSPQVQTGATTGGKMAALKEFKRCFPPEFNGEQNPIPADMWMKKVKNILSIVGVAEEFRVEFASYLFVGEADYWWDSIKDAEDVTTMTWERFEELFLNYYFPREFREAKMEFLCLQQKDLTVMQYAAKFLELSRFAPDLVSTEEKKARRFERGLRPFLRREVMAFEIHDYAEIMNKALLIEHLFDDSKRSRGQTGQRRDGQQRGGFGRRQRQQPTPYQRPAGGQGGSFGGGGELRVCFGCGQKGHIQRYCTARGASQT